jgi:DNA-binding PadR family transcriptional regulator
MTALTIIVGGGKLEGKILKKMHERIIKNFMDIIILAELRNGPMSGYDVISFIHNKFHLLVSSGTVYSLLYSLERNGLIEGTWNERKRVYRLTEKGAKTIETILSANDKIRNFITSLLKVQSSPLNFLTKTIEILNSILLNSLERKPT